MSKETVSTAYKYIRNKILSGQFAPGYRLRTEVLAKEVGFSRTPLRDALRLLEVDGLVSIRPQQGATVKYVSFAEFKDLCGVREALESHAAGLAAANRTDAELADIRAVLDSLRHLTSVFDLQCAREEYFNDLAKADVGFHMSIVNAGKNQLLRTEILRLQIIHRVTVGMTPIYAVPFPNLAARRQEELATLQEHTEIFEAIERKDAAKAKAAMEFHIQRIIGPIIQRMVAHEAMQINADLGYRQSVAR